MRIFGQRIHWMESGNGQALILLHGLGSESSEWGRVAGPLSRKRRVIAPDQIGFGQSDKPFVQYRVATLVSFLEGLYQELRLEQASLMAHGVAGNVAVAFALAHPEKVERLVLANAGFLYAGQDASLLNPASREDARKLVALARFRADSAVADQWFAEAMRSGYANQKLIESLGRADDALEGHLNQLKMPTLIVWGADDKLTPPSIAEKLHKEIVDSQLAILERCGHAPHQEQPALLVEMVERFLSGGKHQKFRKRRDEDSVWF